MKTLFIRAVALFRNKRGSALILGMGILLVSCLLAAVLFVYCTVSIQISHVKETAQNALQTYTIETGREIMQSIKNGHDFTSLLKEERFIKQFHKEMGTNSVYTAHTQNGDLIYRIKELETEFIFDKTLKTKADFILEWQFYFMSEPLLKSDFKISLESRYYIKGIV